MNKKNKATTVELDRKESDQILNCDKTEENHRNATATKIVIIII